MFFRMSAGPQRIPEFTHIHAGRLKKRPTLGGPAFPLPPHG